MYSKIYSAAAMALAATMVSAQTSTTCNPMEKTCPADPAVGKNSLKCALTSNLCGIFTELDGTTLDYGSQGTVFTIKAETNAPTIHTGKYIFFGRVDIEVQAAPGTGIVTSFVLQSDDLDEIDWEWVGGDLNKAQSNYFSKGNDTTFDRGAYHAASAATTSFHTYSVEWTSESVIWLIDNNPVRTLTCADVSGSSACPETPMEIKLGTWVAGRPGAAEGTVEWAGGMADFSQAPFKGYYKNIAITDYAGKSGPTSESVKEYIYGDHSGSWESIKVIQGDGSSDSSSTTKATTHKATSTKETSTKETSTKATTTKATTTKVHSTTEAKTTSTKAETTKTKAKTTTADSTVVTPTPSASATTSESSGSTTTTGAPAQKTTDAPGAAPRSTIALGGAILAVACAMFAL